MNTLNLMYTPFCRSVMSALGLLTMAVSVGTATVPDSTRTAIEQVRTSDDFEPSDAFLHLVEAVPHLAGDEAGRSALAAALLEATGAADTTSLGRSVLGRHLAVVADEEDIAVVRTWLSDSKKAKAARLLLDALSPPELTWPSRAAMQAAVASNQPATRIAGLSALTHLKDPAAQSALPTALGDANPEVRATAIALLAGLDGAALATALAQLESREQKLALKALTLHRVEEAREAVRTMLDRADPALRIAACEALGAVGDVSDLQLLLEYDAHEAISRLAAPGVDTAIKEGLGSEADPARRLTLVQAAAARGGDALWPSLLLAARDADPEVQRSALSALMRMVTPDTSPELISALAAITADSSLKDPQRALAKSAMGRLLPPLPEGISARVYLNCGLNELAFGPDGERLQLLRGIPHEFTENPRATVAYDAEKVLIQASQLKAGQDYWLGFSWWDYDGNGRVQLVTINGQQMSPEIALPRGAQQSADLLTLRIPAEAIKGGEVRIGFQGTAGSNTVVSEVWLAESRDSAEGIRPIKASIAEAIEVRPEIRANKGAPKRVLIVTGLEYHKWRETTPLLVKALAADRRMEISVSEEPAILAQAVLADYDVIVLHYQNNQVPAPEGALPNLYKVIKEGRGLVLVHFASGAFIDWTSRVVPKEFEVLAGRVWNPKLRGHDPHGNFRVRITAPEHPITDGMKDFDTLDELYTMLDGDTPIQVLAEATSKVDGKSYPMVILAEPGEGRTFHCALGHDRRALNEATLRLYRRGTAWAADLPLK